MNKQAIAGWLRTTFAAGGPIAVVIMQKTGISAGDYQMYLEVFLLLAPGAIVSTYQWWISRPKQQVNRVTKLDPETQNKIVDAIKGTNGNGTKP